MSAEDRPGHYAEALETVDRGEQGELLEWLYRPLDERDMPWLIRLGYDWPLDEAAAKAKLDTANRLIDVGSERQAARYDFSAEIAYGARQAFFELLPVAEDAVKKHNKNYLASQGKQGRPPIPDSFVGTRRLLWQMGTDPEKTLRQTALPARPETVLESIRALTAHGLDPARVMRYGNVVGLRGETITMKLQAMYGIARVLGWNHTRYQEEVNTAIETWPFAIDYSLGHLFTLGRLSTVLFEQPTGNVPASDISGVTRTPIERMIAVYLEQGSIIRSPGGLAYQAQRYEEYSIDELRGYIARHAGDPVVRTYLRYYPIDKEEAERLPQHRTLQRQVDWSEEAPFGIDGYRNHVIAPNSQHVRHSLRRMTELNPKNQEFLLGVIADGLQARATDKGFGEAVRKGRWARGVLAASFAKRVLDMTNLATGRRVFLGEDAAQEGLARLVEAIIRVAERAKDKRPEDLWPWLEERILKDGPVDT